MDNVFSNKINLLKALAIILVVSGHLEFSVFGMFPPYSFQLALFFFISGMLFKEKYIDDIKTYFLKRVKSLLLPYFGYEIVYIGITYLVYHFTGKFLAEPVTFKNFFITPFINGHQLLLCAPLWFVPQLFLTLIAFVLIMKLLKNFNDKPTRAVFFLILGFGAIPFIKFFGNNDLTLVVMRLMFSLCFTYFGYFYVKHVKDKINIFTPKIFLSIIFIQAFLWMFNRDFTPEHGIGLSYVLVWGRFDNQIIVPVLTAFTGLWVSLFTIEIMYPFLKDIKLLKDIGSTTYHTMANHLFIMFIITNILCKIHNITIDFGNTDKIYAIYNPVQLTYMYFVAVMLISTYLGVFQKFVWKKFINVFIKK